MSCAPDPEPCESCGAPVMVYMLNGQPVGWAEYQCFCLAADHHFGYPCQDKVPHTPERCQAYRGRADAHAWQDMQHQRYGQCPRGHPARRRFQPDLGELAREIDQSPLDPARERRRWVDGPPGSGRPLVEMYVDPETGEITVREVE